MKVSHLLLGAAILVAVGYALTRKGGEGFQVDPKAPTFIVGMVAVGLGLIAVVAVSYSAWKGSRPWRGISTSETRKTNSKLANLFGSNYVKNKGGMVTPRN